MLKEITETYYFHPDDFNAEGVRMSDGINFRDEVKQWEWNFHELHPTEYALNLYANSRTMHLLHKACGAADFLSYGMELTKGTQFDPGTDPIANRQIDSFSKKVTVYGIDSAFMVPSRDTYGINADKGIYPLTLLIDDTMIDGMLKLSKPYDDDSDDEQKNNIVVTPKTQYVNV